jgi:hypothetical protein
LVGSIAVGLVLLVVGQRLLREENVRVSWDNARRPRFDVSVSTRRGAVDETLPEVTR